MSNVALLSNGAVNNYVDKKRWVWVNRKSTWGHVRREDSM